MSNPDIETVKRRTWKEARPMHDWIIVKADPRVKKSAGGIHLPDAQTMVERVMEGTGRIVRVGNGDDIFKGCGFALEPGMRIAYRGFLKDAWKDYFEKEDGCDVFFLKAQDVLAIVDDSVQMGAYS